jgi:hypothetical protein
MHPVGYSLPLCSVLGLGERRCSARPKRERERLFGLIDRVTTGIEEDIYNIVVVYQDTEIPNARQYWGKYWASLRARLCVYAFHFSTWFVSLHFLHTPTFRHLLPIETLPTLSPFACHYESKTALHHTSPTNSRVRPSSSSEIYIDKAGFSKLGFFFHGSPSGGLCFIFFPLF